MRTALLIRMTALITALLAPILVPRAEAAQRWKLQYFYDDARDVLHFADMAFPTAQRGIAVGTVVDESKRKVKRHVALVTADGGAQWTEFPLDDLPVSLFFLDADNGWLVTEKGLWRTFEAGRQWKRISRQKDIDRVWFLDENHGFAVGEDLLFSESTDGGKTWKPVKLDSKINRKQPGRFYHVKFVTPKLGLAVGEMLGEKGPGFGFRRRLLVELETKDGGVTWTSTSTPTEGRIADLKLSGVDGLVVMDYARRSELVHIDLTNGASRLSYRQDGTKLTSVALHPGHAFLAGVSRKFVGKVKVLESSNLRGWVEMPVDYRAEAGRVVLAGADADHMYLATDQGMILHLE